tara:strand:+ start:106 stop:606 length:501 start_codon:yes stop_codon:yes gene_type:complete
MALFDLDFKKKGEYKLHVKKFFLFPEFWAEPKNQLPIALTWKYVKFSNVNRKRIPTSKGVYAFVLIPKYNNFIDTKYLFYTGKTNRTLKDRFIEYLKERDGKGKPRVKVNEMLNLYDGHLYFFYSEIPNPSDVSVCEDLLINTFVPHVNTQIPIAKIRPELKYIYE